MADGTRAQPSILVGPTRQKAAEIFASELDTSVTLTYPEFVPDVASGSGDFVGVASGAGMVDAVRVALTGLQDRSLLTVAVEMPADHETGRQVKEAVMSAAVRLAGVRQFNDRACLVFSAGDDQDSEESWLLEALFAVGTPAAERATSRQNVLAAEWAQASALEQATRSEEQVRAQAEASLRELRAEVRELRAASPGGYQRADRRRGGAEAPEDARRGVRRLLGEAARGAGMTTRRRQLAAIFLLLGAGALVITTLTVVFHLIGGPVAGLVGFALGVGLMAMAVGGVVMLGLVLSASRQRSEELAALREVVEHEGRRSRHRDGSLRERVRGVGEQLGQHTEAIAALAEHRPVTRRTLDDARRRLASQVQATVNLFQLVRVRGALPALGEWTASADLLVELLTRLIAERPRVVVESGSGVSTVLLALASEQYGVDARIVALEHDADFADQTRELLERHGVADRAEVRWAPLAPTGLAGHRAPWYDAAALADLSDVGLVLVDGPPASTGTASRYPLVPLLKDRFAERCTIVVDDTNRPEDAEVVRRWQDELTDFEVASLSLDKGAAVLSRGPAT